MNFVAILIVCSAVATVGAIWYERSVNKDCLDRQQKKFRRFDFVRKEIFQIRREMSRLQKEIADLKINNCNQNKTDSATKTSLMATEQTPIQLWMETFSNVFTETSLLKILATEFGLLTIRIVGWLAVELILYQGNQLGSKRKKRDYTEQASTRTLSLLQGIRLIRAAPFAWKRNFETEMSEDSIIDNLASVFLNYFRAVVGWITMELVLYQGRFLFGNRTNEKNQTPP